MSGYLAYPGNKADFYNEFGGVPDHSLGIGNIFLIAVIIIIIAIIITAIAFLSTKTQQTFIDNTGLVNLDLLVDLNSATTQCCVFLGQTAPNETYLYDTVNNITYSIQKPLNINTVCNTFPTAQQSSCITNNTDSTGNIVPFGTFNSQVYYQYSYGLASICGGTPPTTTCPAP